MPVDITTDDLQSRGSGLPAFVERLGRRIPIPGYSHKKVLPERLAGCGSFDACRVNFFFVEIYSSW